MPNPLLLYTAQVVSMVSVALLALGYLKAQPRAASARVFAVMACFILLYLFNGMSADHIEAPFRVQVAGLGFLVTVGGSAIPGLFMVYCHLVFQERPIPRYLAALLTMQVTFEASFYVLDAPAVTGSAGLAATLVSWVMTATDLLQLSFAGAAVYWTVKGWSADLVEDRRALRWMVIIVQGGLIFVVVLMENFLLPAGSVNNAQSQAVIVFTVAILALGMVVATMQFDYLKASMAIRKPSEVPEPAEPDDDAPFDIHRFNRAFRDAGLYREAGLTIAGLAKKLSVPEYRLRAFIHKTLGFRNFNAMLHQYRIEDACKALADPKNAQVPVLTIALSVGYQSITPFNNAFRETMGVTPSEYRRKMSAAE